MLTLAVIGDLHLSERSERYRHALDMWDWTITDASQRGANAWLQLGDLCEGRPTPDEWSEICERFVRMAGRGPVGYTEGNHEEHGVGRLISYWPRVTSAWDDFHVMPFVEANVLLVPYPRRGSPPFDGLDTSTIQASMTAAADRVAAAVSENAKVPGRPLLVAGHFTVESMRTRDTEFERHTAREVVVPKAALAGAHLTLVGHVHKAQEFAGPTGPIIGVGSHTRQSFPEAQDEKSYTIVQVEAGKVIWSRRISPTREMVERRVTWDDVLAGALAGWEEPGKEVKLVVEIREEQLRGYDPAAFAAVQASAGYFLLDRKTVPTERVRAPQMVKATTLSQEFDVWMDVTGQKVEPPRRQRLEEKLAVLD